MSMEVKVEKRSGYVYLEPVGRIDTQTAAQFGASVEANLAGDGCGVISFAAVPYMSSAGLRVVMVTAKRFSTGGGRLVLCGLNDFVREVFDISGFSSILNITVDAAEAEAFLAAPPPEGPVG